MPNLTFRSWKSAIPSFLVLALSTTLFTGCGPTIQSVKLPRPAYYNEVQLNGFSADLEQIPAQSSVWTIVSEWMKLRDQLCAVEGNGLRCEKLKAPK